MIDTSKSAQSAVIQFLNADGEHTQQISHKMKEVYGDHYLVLCTICWWCMRYEARRAKFQFFPLPGRVHFVTKIAIISAVDQFIRQNH